MSEAEKKACRSQDGASGQAYAGSWLSQAYAGSRISQAEPGTLYIIATPIGNLEDITLRALHLLASVDIVAAEDTRHTGLLLKAWNIKKPMVSYFEHNEKARSQKLLAFLKEGKSVGLVTDAGLPGISDPGAEVIRDAATQGIPLTVVPGPSAGVTALVASGLPTDGFAFGGFIPRDNKSRRGWLACYGAFPKTVILYESPRRLLATLALLRERWGDRPACVARELTKRYEEFLRGSLSEIEAELSGRTGEIKGEIVLIVGGRESLGAAEAGPGRLSGALLADRDAGIEGAGLPGAGGAGLGLGWDIASGSGFAAALSGEELARRARSLLDRGLTKKEASRELAELSGRPKKELYDFLVELDRLKE